MWKTATCAMAVLAAIAMSGCAGLQQVSSDVSTFSQWAPDRKPTTYAFERLPSQQTEPERQQTLEDAARPALEAAGFRPAPLGTADINVQLSARVDVDERSYYRDPYWYGGGGPFFYGRGRFGGVGFRGPAFGYQYQFATPIYEREVALLMRDRKTGQAVFETRAASDGNSSYIEGLLPAMFEAAMKDFPNGGVNPRRIVTKVQSVPAPAPAPAASAPAKSG